MAVLDTVNPLSPAGDTTLALF